MTRAILPTPGEHPELAIGYTSDGREVAVYKRWFNTILTIGTRGSPFLDDQW